LKILFADYLGHAQSVVLNLDNGPTAELAASITDKPVVTFSLRDKAANVFAYKDKNNDWQVVGKDNVSHTLALQVFGDYNVSNALAAIATSEALGVPREQAVALLAGFKRVARRMDLIASPHGVDVFDDFGHNPDKIAASLSALRDRYARMLIFFQPHGYRPMENMEPHLVETFKLGLRPDDRLWMSEPVYYGGSVERTQIVPKILSQIGAPRAAHLDDRAGFAAKMAREAKVGDCVVIMGARDDTLTDIAKDVARAIGVAPRVGEV
jgi:UDP-N-acetylmuramate--alanine ligase